MTTKTRMSGSERREQLIGIGRALFAEKGFEATSVEELAERAKVSKPIVYEHFGGKEGVYAVVVDREVRHLATLIAAALEGAEHPRAAVERAAEAFLRYIEEQRDGFRVLVRDAPLGSTQGGLTSVLDDVAASAEAILAREFRTRGYDTKNAPLYARALVGMVAFTGQWWLDVGKPQRREVAAHLVNLAWNGLRALDADPTARAKKRAKEREKERAKRANPRPTTATPLAPGATP